MKPTPFNRVTTGTGTHGRSEIRSADPAEVVEFDPVQGRLEDTLWASDIWVAEPATEGGFRESERDEWELEPPAGGAVFRIINFPPHHKGDLHSTDTLDFGMVLSGELWLLVEDGEVHLTEGDCTVIPGAVHAWENRSNRPCTFGAVLLSARTENASPNVDSA